MSAVVPFTARLPQLDPHNVATAQLWQLCTEPHDVALDACIEHLMVNHDMTERRAENAALQALAEIDSVTCLDSIDIGVTTTDAVVISRANGKRVVLTVRDLRYLLEGQLLRDGNKESGNLLVLQRR